MVAQGTAWAQSAFRNGWARGHPAGREALVDGLVEAFFDEVDDRLRATSEEIRPARDTESSDRPWRAELRGIARAFASVVHAHPEILSAVATRPLSVPVARRPGPPARPAEPATTTPLRAVWWSCARARSSAPRWGKSFHPPWPEMKQIVLDVDAMAGQAARN
ncbi:hypothetical protein [Streptomyces sp. NBC_01235]|uniref:hypothetical protein n=1 Tax=Streptomyces sp. NBC_01235 TaxID=2903788 RepID=UPI002E124F6A|nr:hypothetical protein OG289_01445 [Streptomyces sp. NBC_01235]